jgi:hypothetical protein
MSVSTFAAQTEKRHSRVVVAGSVPAAFAEQFRELAGLVRHSHHLYNSPLGPFYHRGRHFPVPRFTFFGSDTTDDSPRLAVLGGFDHRDLRSTYAIIHLVRLLALKPLNGHGLQLAFFPLVDVLGLSGHAHLRRLAAADWQFPETPELDLLSQDARVRSYHGFIRIESTTEDVAVLRLRGLDPSTANDDDLITSADFGPLPVRWELQPATDVADGPLSLKQELPLRPFELQIRLPNTWTPELYREATAQFFKRFVRRYTTYLAHAQNL